MDYEEKRRQQTIRVIIAEIGMVISVIVIVVVAVMVAMGFFISSDGQLEQTGLLQAHSIPTGATVELDGSVLFSHTNISRTLTAGEHHIKLSREGYDTWEKDINMSSGVLTRLYYPRLFLQDRKTEEVMKLGGKAESKDLAFYSPSLDREFILYALNGSAEWRLLDFKSDSVQETILDLSGILPGMIEEKTSTKITNKKVSESSAPDYHFEGKIEELKWSRNSEKVLVKVNYQDKISWVLVNLRNMAESLNLTKEFGMNWDKIEFIDNSANHLFGLENGNLREIDAPDRSMSRVLLGSVSNFENAGGKVVYVTAPKQIDTVSTRSVGTYNEGEKGGVVIEQIVSDQPVFVAISKFYDEEYLAYTVGRELTILHGETPTYKENDEADTSTFEQLGEVQKYSEQPEKMVKSPDGEYLIATKSNKIMAVDLSEPTIVEYEAVAGRLNWFDANSMLYAVKDGQIIVWDFDGKNLRNLSESGQKQEEKAVKAVNRAVVVAPNNRWMYYLVEGKTSYTLMRERLRA